MEAMTYASSGVSIDKGERLVQDIKAAVASTRRPGASAELGSFGGFFDLQEAGFLGPKLVTGTDGVGTKLMIAIAMNKHDTVGINLVACGAEPLWLTDIYSNEGATLGAVNMPEVNLRLLTMDEPNHARIVYIHRNIPGVLRRVNEIFGDHNVDKQMTDNRGDVAYLMAMSVIV